MSKEFVIWAFDKLVSGIIDGVRELDAEYLQMWYNGDLGSAIPAAFLLFLVALCCMFPIGILAFMYFHTPAVYIILPLALVIPYVMSAIYRAMKAKFEDERSNK